MGGLARRATVIKDIREEGEDLLIIDAGNSLFQGSGSPSSMERGRARLVAKAYQQMGYQAINVGSGDLPAGIEFLRQLEKEIHLPFMSANLLDEMGGKPIFRPHGVFDVGGIRVGLFGLTSNSYGRGGSTSNDYFIADPIAAAKRVVAGLAKDCDIIVALSNLGPFKAYTRLINEVTNVHFIFGSGGKALYNQTIRSNKGWKASLFQAYPKGQYLGRIDLKVVKGTRDFVDLGRKAHLERQINRIERQLESYRMGKGMPKSLPQARREELITRFQEFKKRSKARLKALEKDSHGKGTFINTRIRLDDTVKDDLEIRELVDRFKKGS